MVDHTTAALRVNPNLPEPHIYNSWGQAGFQGCTGSSAVFDEAIVEARKAMQLQPDFPVALAILGFSHALLSASDRLQAPRAAEV